jgi:multidrug efflux pump subunit AcrB
MKIVEYALQHKALFWVLMLAVLLGGIASYQGMGKLESPPFKIKRATVTTLYPGAASRQVEREVTEKIEEEIQKMAQVDYLTSVSRNGFSLINVYIRPEVDSAELPQIWDELRRKTADIRPRLPAGVAGMRVGDDYGDVYGMFLAISGKGYGIDELKAQADLIKKQLLLVSGVARVEFWGVQEKAIYVEFDRARLAGLGITQQQIFQTLESSNAQADAGSVHIADEYASLMVSGSIDSLDDIRDLIITGSPGTLLRLGDIARVSRGHAEPASQIMRFNGEPAIGIGISAVEGANVVSLGNAIQKRLEEMRSSLPGGMTVGFVNYQSDDVRRSIKTFMANLVESVGIVIAVLLLTMGLRSGIAIGATLLLTILGTFICMHAAGIDLHMVSLGTLILALGMLVDNAIVIADGYLVKTAAGARPEAALSEIARETAWPLLGATLVAILAFGSIGLNTGNVGEFCRSLFSVIAISLLLSWIMALTFTPLLCLFLIRPQPQGSGQIYGGAVYRAYRCLLAACLRHRTLTMGALFAALAVSAAGFLSVPQSFFPDSARTKFYIDYWRNSASHIDETAGDVRQIAAYVSKLPGIRNVTEFVGAGSLRFLFSYDVTSPSPDYGQLVMETDSVEDIDALTPQIEAFLARNFPSADAMVLRFSDVICIPSKVAVRFSGPDSDVLRELAAQAKEIMRQSGHARHIRDDWRPPVKTSRILYSELKGRSSGITRKDLAQSLQWNFSGVACGAFREGDELIPIISRPVREERSFSQLSSVQVWNAAGRNLPLEAVTDGFETVWVAPQIWHRDRIPTITAQCSEWGVNAAQLRDEIKEKIGSIHLPPLYTMEWAGEYEQKEDALEGVRATFPFFMLLMFLMLMSLFRTLREPVLAFCAIPFALIGVVAGLLVTGKSFGFMAILGFLGLTGMLLKNSIVLLDQIGLERKKGRPPYAALVEASVSRLRPVTMAAGTTVLGILPLLFDVFFDAMAATIVFGLLAATLLTLIVIPVGYALAFGVREPCKGS